MRKAFYIKQTTAGRIFDICNGIIIGILMLMLSQSGLADVALIYAMISFLAVVVLCKVYMGVYLQKQKEAEKKQEEENADA